MGESEPRRILLLVLLVVLAGCLPACDRLGEKLAPLREILLANVDPVGVFGQTVHPILQQHCSSCHAGAGPATPHIAHPDLPTAYAAVVDNQKVDLVAPATSRLVRRLVADFHYCWGDCAENGAEMQSAIQTWAAATFLGSTELL